MIVWIIGLSGAGKTTLGRALYRQWKAIEPATVFVDGDDFRDIMGNDLGFSLEDREKNGKRLSKLCSFLDKQSINVVVSILSNFPMHQQWNRENFSYYFEIFIDLPLAVLERRDQKGLYSSFRAGTSEGVVGLDIPFKKPKFADLTISIEDQTMPVEDLAKDILIKHLKLR